MEKRQKRCNGFTKLGCESGEHWIFLIDRQQIPISLSRFLSQDIEDFTKSGLH